ncbi:hypothetical protein SAMN04488498_108100 [Mesorhizobium albiziae]|uniref:Uncharacterized protein n=1 Tax=Neomesorhizobium albiziae TaxID=335020 RepID=A0A1I4AJ09_9HYPH|nr:hypothetical protein SAMN04488498_108100 [Mesorhizobium albiziae]
MFGGIDAASNIVPISLARAVQVRLDQLLKGPTFALPAAFNANA